MMSRLIFKRASVLLIACLASIHLLAYSFSAGGVYYNITSQATSSTPGAVSVTSGDGYSGTITIPATVENGGSTYNVTAIEAQAFQNSIHLRGVNMAAMSQPSATAHSTAARS